jgi:O-antigen biosynthesis protein
VTLHRQGPFSEPHHQALETLCVKALQRGDLAAAFRLSDRRCRIRPLPEAHCYVLRAEALYRMKDRAGAVSDLATALRIAPEDLAANRRMLAWGKRRLKAAAARTLIDCERDPRILRQAIALLRERGQTAFAGIQVGEDVIDGWAAWQGEARICLSIAGEAECVETVLAADAGHPLSTELGNAVSFQLPRGPAPQLVSVSRDREVLVAVRTTRREGVAAPALKASVATAAADASVTVIVPVYADYRATRACLESLLGQLDAAGRVRVIIVNDASPDPRIRKWLDGLAPAKHVRVLTNPGNLGFVGAVNRALQEVSCGDVILLNADTIVPQGFIERLASAARSAPDIGTVTPLSNNGEFTSFPVPNRPNIAGNALDVDNIDRIAARVNARGVVDMPNGIGFCLYVTRRCLDAVGLLSESYYRGYLEDVDFCLRARHHGLRNVCATSVYVGHAGSRSFGKQKRALVVRNLKVIEQRFPAYRAECADFMLADPLKPARQAIESSLMASRAHGNLLVTGSGAVAEVARERARQLRADGVPGVLILEMALRSGRIMAKLRDAIDAVPQSLEFLLPGTGEAAELLRFLRQLQLAGIEFFDLARIPRAVADALLELAVPYDIFLAHTELGVGQTSFQTGDVEQHGSARPGEIAPDPLFWSSVIEKAGRVLVPDAQGEAVASSLSLQRPIIRLAPTAIKSHRVSKRSNVAANRLGLVPVRGCAQEYQFMRDIIAGLTGIRPNLDIVITGTTHDDSDLMRTGQAFVTGPVEATELGLLFRRFQFDRIVLCMTQPLFGHPVPSAATASGLPVAYFDWSPGGCQVRSGDLPLDPSLSAAVVVERLLPWLQGRQPA